jgi:protein tyrosine phosphatase
VLALQNVIEGGIEMKNKPTFEVSLKSVVEVRVDGCDHYRQASSMEEAKVVAKEMQVRAKEKWEQEHSEDKKRKDYLNFIEQNVSNYAEHLKKELWHDVRRFGKDDASIKVKREILRDLSGILKEKKMVVWHQGYFNEATSYTVEDIKKEDGDEE